MKTSYKDFCKKYKEKLVNDKDIEENKIDIFQDIRPRISFKVVIEERVPNTILIGWSPYIGTTVFTLDKEDLEYLYKKYSGRVKEEMEQNIAKVKESYEDFVD
jgi:hypothetical protein